MTFFAIYNDVSHNKRAAYPQSNITHKFVFFIVFIEPILRIKNESAFMRPKKTCCFICKHFTYVSVIFSSLSFYLINSPASDVLSQKNTSEREEAAAAAVAHIMNSQREEHGIKNEQIAQCFLKRFYFMFSKRVDQMYSFVTEENVHC